MFVIFMILSALCLVLFGFFAVKMNFTYKRTQIMTPSRLLAIGVFAASWFLVFPYYYAEVFRDLGAFPRIWESIWVSVHHVIRFFVVDVDFADIKAAADICGSDFYVYLGTLLIILAPILTFSVILSFWQNFDAYRRFIMHPYAPAFVFSELNEKSLTLAKDIKETHKSAIVIFTDIFEPDNEESFDLLESAKELGALCFKKDMLSLNLKFHSEHSPLYFFAIAEPHSVRGVHRNLLSHTTAEEENLRQARQIMTDKFYSKRPNTYLFVFSASTLGEMLFDSLPASAVIARRVNRYASFIRRTLYKEGKEMLFDTALDTGGEEKEINAVILGSGKYGGEMIKTLPWFCQMDGYRLNIDVFDGSPDAEEHFVFKYPGLMGECNGNFDSYEMPRYKITFHSGIDVSSISFARELEAIKNPTYILVALGSDELNVKTAVEIRRILRRAGCPFDPRIDAIVYNKENKDILDNATKRGIPYKINCIGNLRETFSFTTVTKDDIRDNIEAIYQEFQISPSQPDDYTLNSTEVSFIHSELCKKLGKHISSNADLLSEEDSINVEMFEHRRWVAYMFSEGYIYGEHKDPVAKTNRTLLPYSELPNTLAPKERVPKNSAK